MSKAIDTHRHTCPFKRTGSFFRRTKNNSPTQFQHRANKTIKNGYEQRIPGGNGAAATGRLKELTARRSKPQRGENGRAGEIRTHDLLHPMQARYQATLQPELEGSQSRTPVPEASGFFGNSPSAPMPGMGRRVLRIAIRCDCLQRCGYVRAKRPDDHQPKGAHDQSRRA
jgi:hypothetical protein